MSASSLNRNRSAGEQEGQTDRPLFQHRPWMAGIVVVFAFAAIVAGLGNPVWLLIGSPFILALVLFIGVRLASRRR